MSRKVDTDYPFDASQFSEILNLAKCGRTQTMFAQEAGLSTAYICKYLNAKVNKAPTPSTIAKISCVASEYVTFNQLLKAAGYDPNKYAQFDPWNKRSLPRTSSQYANQYKAAIRLALDNRNYICTTANNCKMDKHNPYTADLSCPIDYTVNLQNSSIKYWYFVFLSSISEQSLINHSLTAHTSVKNIYTTEVLPAYGWISIELDSPNTKISFVTESEETFSYILSINPLVFSSPLSVILIDVYQCTVKKEQYLKNGCMDIPTLV